MENNKIKNELRVIYNFLNNTKGNIYHYELQYLYDTYNIDRFICDTDIEYLSELIENGNEEDTFINYFIGLIEEQNITY